MKSISITGSVRADLGKNTAREVRASGEIPCVLYGGTDLLHFSASEAQFKKLLYTPEVFTVNLDVNGKNYQAVLREVQVHPVSDAILHMDFLQLSADKPVVIDVPVHVVGNSIGVKQGGKLIIKVRKLKVKSLPADLPESITLNVDDLEIGKSIRVRDINLKNIEILDSPNNVVTGVQITRQVAAEAAAPAAKK
jgi:large subunit ribosomal protein L25